MQRSNEQYGEKIRLTRLSGYVRLLTKMNLKTLIFTTPMVALSAVAVLAAPNWEADFEKGLATAKAENRVVVLEVTGCGWCPPCQQL